MPEVALGVTGSIAAYKACDLASRMVAEGIGVRVVMTRAALRLVGAASFQAVSGNPVVTSVFHLDSPGGMQHIALADACAMLVIAPATADVIGKLASGIADDALTTLALSVDCPKLLAPAMNPRMWANSILQENVARLAKHGWAFVGPEEGRVACGATGVGRMAEPAAVLDAVRRTLGLRGK